MSNLALDFINTRWYLSHTPFQNVLADPAWLADFLQGWGLPPLDSPSPADLARMIELREFLSGLVDALRHDPVIPSEQLDNLNRYLALSPMIYTLVECGSHYRKTLLPGITGLESFLFQVAVSFADLIGDAKIERIKRCQNPACGWVYLDESKNNSRKWCGNTCSSLIKVRRFRQRLRDQ